MPDDIPDPTLNADPDPDDSERTQPIGPRRSEATDQRPPVIEGYRIDAEIGRGGMGIVYKAHDLQLKRAVAIKMIRSGLLDDPRQRVRFQHEAEAIAGLRHHNIIQIYRVGESDGHPYLVLEYVEGTLAGKLEGGPLRPKEAAQLARDAASGVAAAHAQGIVHRDLKPANVLIGEHDHPRITDFGLAKILDRDGHTRTGEIMGTPTYMAPEQAESKSGDVGPPTDVYALGCILYEMLTGHPPFQGVSALGTLTQHMHADPVPPRRLQPQVPRDLETVTLQCLSKPPAKRYADAGQLADDLDRFVKGEPVHARPMRWWGHAARWARRRPVGVTAFAFLVGTLLFVAGAGWWVALRQAEAERAAEGALAAAELYLEQGNWSQATEALTRAGQLLDTAPIEPSELRRLLGRRSGEIDLVHDLDAARSSKTEVDVERNRYLVTQAIGRYTDAFSSFAVPFGEEDIDTPAARLLALAPPLLDQVIVALDDWLILTKPTGDEYRRDWVRRLLAKIDEDPLRRRLREADVRGDVAALKEIALGDQILDQPAGTALLLGSLLRSNADEAAAHELLTRVQRLHPDNFWVNHTLAMTCRNTPGGIKDAILYHSIAHALRPDNVGEMLNLARALRLDGRREESAELLRRVIELRPDYRAPYLQLADTLNRMREFEQAVAVLREGLSHAPDSADMLDRLAHSLSELGRFDEAIDAHNRCLAISPVSPHYHNLALTYRDAGDLDAAARTFLKAIEVEPGYFLNYYSLGQVYRSQRRMPEAIAMVRKAVTLNPDFTGALRALADLLRQSGDLDEAILHYREYLKITSFQSPPVGLGWALRDKGLHGEAAEFFSKALVARPTSQPYHFELGKAYLRLGDFRTALRHLDAAGGPTGGVYAAELAKAERYLSLAEQLPELLAGRREIGDQSDRLAFAEICLAKGHFEAAAGLYRDAFAEDESARGDHLLPAVEAAIQAGEGDLARNWMAAELARYREDPSAVRKDVNPRRWQQHATLEVVRERGAGPWVEFWREVEAVLADER